LEPVKCWSRLPNWSGSTTRKSTAIPVWVRPRAAFSPAVPDDSMTSSSANALVSAAGSEAVAMMSRSLTLSVRRRADPATSTLSEAGCASRAPTICSAIAAPWAAASAARACRRRRRRTREHLLLELPAEAADVAQPLLLGGLLQRLERVDPQLVEELAGALGPEARQPGHVDEPGRELRAQLLERGDRPRVEQGHELLLERLADPRSVVTRPSRVSAATPTGASRTALAALR
jgi:hypothetical protein